MCWQSAAGKYSNGVPKRSLLMFCLVLIAPPRTAETQNYTCATMGCNVANQYFFCMAVTETLHTSMYVSRCKAQIKCKKTGRNNVSQQCATQKIHKLVEAERPHDDVIVWCVELKCFPKSRSWNCLLDLSCGTLSHMIIDFENQSSRIHRINRFDHPRRLVNPHGGWMQSCAAPLVQWCHANGSPSMCNEENFALGKLCINETTKL